MSKLSSAALSGSFAPERVAHVAMMSVRQIVWFEVLPASIFFGQRAMNGTRWPPSHWSRLTPRQGLAPSWLWVFRMLLTVGTSGPLSLLNRINVFSPKPSSSIFLTNAPKMKSISKIKSPCGPAFVAPLNARPGKDGK